MVLNGPCPKDPIFMLEEAHYGTQLECYNVRETLNGTRRKGISKIYYNVTLDSSGVLENYDNKDNILKEEVVGTILTSL